MHFGYNFIQKNPKGGVGIVRVSVLAETLLFSKTVPLGPTGFERSFVGSRLTDFRFFLFFSVPFFR